MTHTKTISRLYSLTFCSWVSKKIFFWPFFGRFEPEKSHYFNRGLEYPQKYLSNLRSTTNSKISLSDLWVLASYGANQIISLSL